MKPKTVIFFVMLAIVLGLIIYYYVYPEFLFEKYLKEKFEKEFGEILSLECFGYRLITTAVSNYTNQSLAPKQQVNLLRWLLNQNYTNFTKLQGITDLEQYVRNLIYLTATTNFVETVYNLLSDVLPNTPPKTCKPIRSIEEITKYLLLGKEIAESGILAFELSSVSVAKINQCKNISDKKKCIEDYINLIKSVAEEKKNSLPEYKEVKLGKCPNTLLYLQVKDLEKNTRSQLIGTEDPLSIIWKSLKIAMYDNCSQFVYDRFISKHNCQLIPINKPASIGFVVSATDIFGICSSEYLKNELSTLRERMYTH